MGSSHSKQVKEGSKAGKNSPSQEKHVSSTSTAPLAANAAQLAHPQSPVVEKHVSFDEKSTLGRSRTHTLSNNGDVDAITPVGSTYTNAPLKIHTLDGHSDVSRPPPPPRLHRLSQLIDPADLATADGHVRSPSGNLLAPAQWLVHPDRPRSIRERQEIIHEKVRAASRLGVVESAEDAKAGKGKKAKTGKGKTAKEVKMTKNPVKKEKTNSGCACYFC